MEKRCTSYQLVSDKKTLFYVKTISWLRILKKKGLIKTILEEQGTNLQRKELKPNAVPSLFPDCPKLLSKVPPKERPTCTSTSTARYERQHEFKNTFVSLDDLEVKLDMATLPNSITKSRCPRSMMFCSVFYEGKPEINYCLKLNNDLQFELWCNGKIQKSENHSDEELSCSSLRSCYLLLKILNYLQDEFNNRSVGVCTDKEKMNDITYDKSRAFE